MIRIRTPGVLPVFFWQSGRDFYFAGESRPGNLMVITPESYVTVGTPIRVSNARNSERSSSVSVRVGNRLGPPGRPQSSNAAFTTALSPPVRAHILRRKSDQGQFA